MKNYLLLITMHADPAMPPGYDEWGGTHAYMKELLDIFGEEEISCILITRKSMEFLPMVEQYNQSCKIIRIINGPDGPMSKLELHNYHQENIDKILEIIGEQEELPRVIHSVYWNSGRLAMELSNQLKVPYVHSVISNSKGRVNRGATEPIPERSGYEQKIYEHADAILCVSDDEKKDLIKFYGITPDKLIVCGQFIAKSFLCPAHDMNGFPRFNSKITEQEQGLASRHYNKVFHLEDESDHFWLHKAFTYLGRMDENKGVIQILRAWSFLANIYMENCPPLWMVGGSIAEISNIRKKAKKYIPELSRLEENYRIVWWGYLNADGLSTILMKTQVVITHSLYEPGGRVSIEAMCSKVPVIATPNGFAKDAIRDWENGFLVEYGDIRKLSARMEHFIRQPLLGNSMGMNALESAIGETSKWAFTQNHLFAYGIVDKPIYKAHETKRDYYARKIVHLFPYCVHSLSNEYLINIFTTNCQKPVYSIKNIDPGICTSDMKLLTSSDGNYIIKHVFVRLATSPFYNPFLKEQIVREAQRHFDIEMNVYHRLNNNVFLCEDPLHHLMFLRELNPMDKSDDNYLENCIQYLVERKRILTADEKNIYIRLIEKSISSFEEIEELLQSLNKQLPSFYFECSGMFSNRVAWSIASYVLAYNKIAFNSTIYSELKNICNFFQSFTYCMDYNNLRDINLDIEQRHLMIFEKEIYLIDHEKTSIGIVEMDIAAFLNDYYRNDAKNDIIQLLKNVTPCLEKLNLQKNEIIAGIAYRFFYDIIVDTVMKCKQQKSLLASIKKLQLLMEQ